MYIKEQETNEVSHNKYINNICVIEMKITEETQLLKSDVENNI
jgi:hypothetical protein